MFNFRSEMKKRISFVADTSDEFADILQEVSSEFDYGSDIIRQKNISIRNGEFNVVVMGRFKTGKSTFVNSLLGKETMAAKATACTAVITSVGSGTDEEHVTIHFNDGTTEKMNMDDFKEEYQINEQAKYLIDDACENDKDCYLDRFRKVDHVSMESKHEMFKNGCFLTDTPGLEESISRDTIIHKFLPKAYAIIFVMSATSLFSKLETKIINEQFSDNKENVFFVVNHVNYLHPGELESKSKPAVRAGLQNVFKDANGDFDEELYNKRVFFVNAYYAECARVGKKAAVFFNGDWHEYDPDINTTGIPEFETELDNFLNSEARVTATLQTALDPVCKGFREAVTEMNKKKAILAMKDGDAQQKVERAKKDLESIDKEIQKIEKCIDRFAVLAANKCYFSLDEFLVHSVKGNFRAYVKNNVTGQDFGLLRNLKYTTFNLVSRIPIEKRRRWEQEKIEGELKPMTDDIISYVCRGVEEWKRQIPSILQKDLQDFYSEIYEICTQISEAFDNANGEFDMDLPGEIIFALNTERSKRQRAKELAISVIATFLQQDLSDLKVKNGNMNTIESIFQNLIQSMIDNTLGAIAPDALFLKFAINALIMALSSRDNAQYIELTYGTMCIDAYINNIKDNEIEFKENMINNFKEKTEKVKAEITEKRKKFEAELNSDLEFKRKTNDECQNEVARLDELTVRMHDKIRVLYNGIYGHDPSDSEFENLIYSI